MLVSRAHGAASAATTLAKAALAFLIVFRHTIGAIRHAMFTDYRFVEFWSGLIAAAWGVWNLTDAQDLMKIQPYRYIDIIFPEPIIEVVAMFLGAFQVSVVVTDDAKGRLFAAFFSCWFYSFFVYSFITASVVPTTIAFVAGWVGVNVLAIVRLTSGAK